MEEQSKDDQIRDAIMQVLHNAYRNPRGRYIHVTMPVIWQDVRESVGSSREDIVRELKYLELHSWIKKVTKKSKVGTNTFTTEYFELSQQGVDLFEHKGKYSKADLGWQTKLPTVRIENSTIHGPVTIGSGNIVNSYNTTTDMEKILQLVDARQEISETQKTELKELIKEELEPLLKNPNLAQSKPFIEKLKSFGQIWLAPIITQLIASYLAYHLGIPPAQIPQMPVTPSSETRSPFMA